MGHRPHNTDPVAPSDASARLAAVRTRNPVTTLFWRLFAINGLLFAVGTFLLAITPITVSTIVNPAEIPVLIVGLGLILAANALLVRRSLAQLEAQYIASGALALAAQEAERQRIARELHDEIGQSLTVALLSLKRVADRAPEELHEEAEFAQAAVRDSLEDVRQVARRLRPGVLADLGLRVALKELAADVARTGRIDINRSMPRELPEIGGEAELVIYRVAQEALTNVVRHARASHADLSIVVKEDRVVLRVSDDGHGGDYVEGVGIRGMRERAALVGAELSVSTNSVGGTEVRLVVPRPSEGRSRR